MAKIRVEISELNMGNDRYERGKMYTIKGLRMVPYG